MNPREPGPFASPRVVDVRRRAELQHSTEPNGWYVGPPASPDRFQLLGPGLGGADGIVWRARYRGTESSTPLTLAVKQLRRPPGDRVDWPTPGDGQRWAQQCELLQRLSVDHLVTMVDIFIGVRPHPEGDIPPPLTPLDTPYVVTEWVSGRTLADEFRGIPVSHRTIRGRLTHLQHVAQALHAAHIRSARGLVGTPALLRDVKPENCVLDPARGVVLVDVGAMRLVGGGHRRPGSAYTAPEVLDDPTGHRAASADLYSLGALAYFCVVGQDPPDLGRAPEAGQLIGRRLLTAARAARVADAHGFVDHLRLMLQLQPDARPVDAVAWARRLCELSERTNGFGRTGTRIAVAVAAAVAGSAALAATGWHYQHEDQTVVYPGGLVLKDPMVDDDPPTPSPSITLTPPPHPSP